MEGQTPDEWPGWAKKGATILASGVITVLAAGVINLTSIVFSIRDQSRDHELYISDLYQFKNAGGRCTQVECAQLTKEQVELEQRQNRIWADIRSHYSKGEHEGANYRLNELSRRLDDLLERLVALERSWRNRHDNP